MGVLIDHPVRAGELPADVRGAFHPDALVRVSLELVQDENGFTPEQAAELRAAIAETADPANVVGPFQDGGAALDFLRGLDDAAA